VALSAVHALAAAPDPIFAAIEAHRAAHAQEEAAVQAESDLFMSLPEDVTRDPRARAEFMEQVLKPKGPLYFVDRADIDGTINKMEAREKAPGSLKGAREYFHQIMDEDEADLKAKRDAVGLTALEQRREATVKVTDQRTFEMVDTMPTTMAGCISLLRYAAEFLARNAWSYHEGEDACEIRLHRTLAAALAAISMREGMSA
jgi:hypothetical protein